jgi:chromosome partitioning protein
MKIVSMINYKGGVGKTTLAANLSTELAKRGYNVLAIDLDPQASLTFSFMKVEEWKNHYEKNKTIKKYLDDFIEEDIDLDLNNIIIQLESINEKINGTFNFICSHLSLINIDIDLAIKLSGTPKQFKRNFIKVMSIIKRGLKPLNRQYDIVLIDCPPNFNIVTKNALVASDYYVVPTRLDYLSTLGVNHLVNHINDLVKQYNLFIRGTKNELKKINPELIGIVGNMVGIYSSELIEVNKHYLEEIKKLQFPLFETYIRESKSLFSDNSEYGVPIVLKEATRYNDIKNELELLTDEFIEKVGLKNERNSAFITNYNKIN